MDNMDLFSYLREKNMEKESPLAARIRPATLEEIVGQQHIIGKDKMLYRAIRADKLFDPVWTTRNGKNNTRQSDCEYDECGLPADECDSCRQKGYGGSCGKG